MGERILQDFGLELMHGNKIKTLRRTLDMFAIQTIEEFPWLSFYYGVCLQESQPVNAYPFISRAQHLFSEQGNEIGILVTNSQLIEYHSHIDGHFNKMVGYIDELEQFYREKSEVLPLPLKIRTAYALAVGFCLLQKDMEKVKHYDTFVLEMSISNSLDNLTAKTRMIRGYRFCFVGNCREAKGEIEASLNLLNNPLVATLPKVFLQMMQINLLEMMGDFINYRHQKQLLFAASESDAVSQSLISPFISIWDIDIALAENDVAKAATLVSEALQKGYSASSPHMRSQFLHYQALIFALQKKKEEALATIEQSVQLRNEAGGRAFVLLNRAVLGKAYALLGMTMEAEDLFAEALMGSDQLGEEFQKAGILADRSWLRLHNGEKSRALKDAGHCLQLMKKNGFRHFFSLLPDLFIPVVTFALNNNVEREFAAALLYDQFNLSVSKNSHLVPLLELHMLSDWSITSGDGARLSMHELSEHERQMLYSIVEGHGAPVDRNVLAERIWPDKDEQKQRNSLDVLISTFRKKLAPLVSPHDSKEYLSIEQGRIRLRHCRIDVQQFIEHLRNAEVFYNRDEVWQAGNSFHLAFRLLGQMGLKGVNWNGSIPSIVENRYLSAVKIWSSHLERSGRRQEARALLEDACLQIPLNCELARLVYDLHANSHDPVAANEAAEGYRKALLNSGYDDGDIEEMMSNFWN